MSLCHHLAAAVPFEAVAPMQRAADAYALTSGRVWSLVGAAVGLAGIVAGGWALARAARRPGTGRRAGIAALVAGVTGAVVGGLVVAAAEGGPGTGHGIVGGYVSLVVGLAATLLAGLALARSRRATGPQPGPSGWARS